MRSTRTAATELGLTESALFGLIRRGVVQAPPRITGSSVYGWTDAYIESARKAIAARRRAA